MGIRISLLFFFCLGWLVSFAQLKSNKRALMVPTRGEVYLSTQSIVPNTVTISGLDSSYYHVDFINGTLKWRKKPLQDSVLATFRVFPYRLNAVKRRFSYDSIQNITISANRIANNKINNQDNFFNFGNIEYNGSFGRSISFGNSQDAVFNSQFNLQMNGYIGDSIHLAAAITDNNIPIQPDGTTQQLNEFDQVLIQFRKKNWEVNLGDVDLRQNDNYFINFYKRLEGLTYSQISHFGKNITNKTLVAGAIAKGKFARNVLTVTEGNQGPYPLVGNNNETYFVVLAGTEKVYMDGVLLQRGQDQDYVINYNTAQITFTSKTLISADKRIQVDFEYADRNYLNSLMYVSNETQFGSKLKVNIAAYSNADAKNSSINQSLDTYQKQFLADLGDSISNAYYQSVAPQAYDPTLVMYQKIDTVVSGIHDSIFVYSTDSLVAHYAPAFVRVGVGNGDYILLNNASNGKSYGWVAPVNGAHQGEYTPATFLTTPKTQQLVTANVSYNINKKDNIQLQLAGSRYDINTFSSKDKNNDNGFGTKIDYTHLDQFLTEKHRYNLKFNASYELEDSSFRTIERLRPVEFTRDWGLPILATQSSEKLANASVEIKNEKNDQLSYQIGSYTRGDGYKGIRNRILHQQNTNSGWQFNEALSYTKMNMPDANGYYLKPTVDISKLMKSLHNITIGAGYLMEKNAIKYKQLDSMDVTSFEFETISAYIKSDKQKPNNWTLSYYTRKDFLPDSSFLKQITKSNNFSFDGQIYSLANHKFKFNMTYRELSVQDTLRTSSKADKTLLGRLEYNVNEWKGFLVGNALYEIGSGQEQQREFTYIKVNNGLGQYTWNDYNNDGVAQLNEFELSAFRDQANYIRVYTTTGTYIKANYTQLNYSFSLNPASIIDSKAKSWKGFARRFNMQSSLQTSKKVINAGTIVFNPFQGSINDTSLLNLNYIWSNTLSFNRSSILWGADVTRLLNYDKSLLTYGSESTQVDQWSFKERVNINRLITLSFQEIVESNNLSNRSYTNRNYALSKLSLSPTVTYTAGSRFRVSGSYQYISNKNEEEYGGENATTNAVVLESKLNSFQDLSLSARLTFNQISYTGDVNSTVGYNMLGGLVPGKNYIWNINMTKRFLKNLEFTLQYDGRKPATTKIVHIGTVTIRAIL